MSIGSKIDHIIIATDQPSGTRAFFKKAALLGGKKQQMLAGIDRILGLRQDPQDRILIFDFRRRVMESQTTYNYKVVRQFAIMTVVWGIVGMLVGVIVAAQLAFPNFALWDGISFLSYGRLRPLHTNAVIFAFGGSALFATSYYVVQRTNQARLFGQVCDINQLFDGFARQQAHFQPSGVIRNDKNLLFRVTHEFKNMIIALAHKKTVVNNC